MSSGSNNKNHKIKGFFKGLKFLTPKFESGKQQPEMQIGTPTDVKHVAHIGWDGSSVNPPSWMSDNKGEGSDATGESETDATTRSAPRDLPKASRRSVSEIHRDGSVRGKSKGPRKSSRHSLKVSDNAKSSLGYNSDPESSNPDREATKKTRRKKTKDTVTTRSRKSRSSRASSDSETGSSSLSKPKNYSSDGLS